eukprot:640120-Rhodomonas_salina.1
MAREAKTEDEIKNQSLDNDYYCKTAVHTWTAGHLKTMLAASGGFLFECLNSTVGGVAYCRGSGC